MDTIVRGQTVAGTNAGSFAPHRQAEADPAALMPVDPRPASRFCQCEPHTEDRGGGYVEYMLEYEPSCPVHTQHVYDPRSDTWVFATEPDAGRALHELTELCAQAGQGNVSAETVMTLVSRLRAALHLPETEPAVDDDLFGELGTVRALPVAEPAQPKSA